MANDQSRTTEEPCSWPVSDCSLGDEITRMRGQLIPMQTAGWQPIESAPRDGTRILVWPAWGALCAGTRAEVVLWTVSARRGGRWECHGGMIPVEPTHWMDLDRPHAK
jgi:hypothetical protein